MATRYNLTPRDVEAINTTAGRLGIRPADLVAVMHYETIGTMNPTIKGGKGGNYQGLIQFGPHERRVYGYDPSASFAEQVEGPVYRYLKDRGLQPGDDVGRLYRTINGGNRNAKLTKNDGNGTIAQHIARIKQNSLPVAVATLQGVPAGPDMTAIMDVASRNDGTGTVPDQMTAAQGFAPDLGGVRSAPAQMAIADMLGGPQSPMPTPQAPPQWAQASAFPIDESLSGANAQDVLMGGPRMDPRRAAPGSAPMPPNMGAMLSPADVLNAGPNLRPGGAPDASAVPDPTISPFRPAMGGPADRRPQPPMPTIRPGGAPDAASVPMPPPRAQGIPQPPSNPRRDPLGFPIDVNRPRINNPDGSFSTERTTTFDAAEVGLPPEIVTVPTIVNGRQVSEDEARALFASGQNPPVQRGFDSFDAADRAAEARTGSIAAARATNGERGFPSMWGEQPGPPMPPPAQVGDMSAAMGSRPSFAPKTPQITDAFKQSFDLANDMNTTRENTDWWTGDLRPQSSPPPMPPEARTKDDAWSPPQGPFFDAANPGLSLPPSWSSATGFPAPPPPNGTVAAGSTGGEFFTPAPPMPSPPAPNMMADRFNDAFSPGGGGQIMDLQSAFNNRNAPPTMNAQGGINEVFGAPPAPAAPPNLAIPFAEVPGFDMGRFAGPAPAEAATIASPLPMPSISRSDFDARFAGGTAVRPPTPVPGQPGVVAGTMPGPMPPPVQGGPPMHPTPIVQKPPASPRNEGAGAQRQKTSLAARIFGGLLGGPVGALGGGLLGGVGGSASFSPFSGSGMFGTAPSTGMNGQAFNTTYQHGSAGNMNGTMWNRSGGGSVGYVTDPFTGAMIYSSSPTGF